AVAYASYALSDAVFALPRTPLPAFNLLLSWAEQKDKNRDGVQVAFTHVKNPASTLAADLASVRGARLSVFVDAADLIRTVPSLYRLAGNASAANPRPLTVIHASAASLSAASSALPVLAHISPIFVVFAAESAAQEAHDLAGLAHLVAVESCVPSLVLRSVGPRPSFQDVVERKVPKVAEPSHKFNGSTDAVIAAFDAAVATLEISDLYPFFQYSGPASATRILVIPGTFPSSFEHQIELLAESSQRTSPIRSLGVLRVRVFRPWSSSRLLSVVPHSATHVAVLEPIASDASVHAFGPLFLDVATSFQEENRPSVSVSEARLRLPEGHTVSTDTVGHLVHAIVSSSSASPPPASFDVVIEQTEKPVGPTAGPPISLEHPEVDVEGPYLAVLEQFFKNRLHLTNVVSEDSLVKKTSEGNEGVSAEFGLGRHLAEIHERDQFFSDLKHLVSSHPYLPTGLVDSVRELSATSETDLASLKTYGTAVLKALDLAVNNPQSVSEQALADILKLHERAKVYLSAAPPSRWVLGGDRLAYDIGTSGVHHVIASKANVKILLLDTQPYVEKKNGDNRKKDVGLYAMTYGGVYVASVALQASYAGVIRALQEADAFVGPSVILAYSPRQSLGFGGLVRGGGGIAATAALASLKETKLAVDDGLWPLYRWQPGKIGPTGDLEDPVFHLDSERLRGELEEFLDRTQYLSMVANAEPDFSTAVESSIEKELKDEADSKIRGAYEELLASLNTMPILILYGSDGGNAAGVAKKLAAESRQRGLKPKVAVMDEFSVEDLAKHKDILFVVSTAGQGEFPGNSRELWKALQQATAESAEHLASLRYSVFAMGDSHYWPLPSDAHFFCKSGKDLDSRLAALGAKRLFDCGIGDDRAADGFTTGYRDWSAEIFTALGVGGVEVSDTAAAGALPEDDAIKTASNFLRGTIAPGLEDTSTGALSELDTKITKFHGIYQQDDRDLRDARARAGFEKAFSFMVRVRVPGGVASPEQWLSVDDIADARANGTIKLTTRQAFQFHGILKRNLKKSIQEINQALMDTLAACGDVNRNVMCSANPHSSAVHSQVLDFSRKLSSHLSPRTSAYHEIWLDKKVVASTDEEPIYGKTYLPRKFKVAVAVPPINDVDVFAHDLGYIAIAEGDRLIGFNVTVGGGMGMTHGMKTTYPRLGDVIGFCTPEQAVEVGEKVVLVQRDNGERKNRKHARLKYTIDDHGIEWFKGEVERRLGYKLEPARPHKFTTNTDRYGWISGPVLDGQPTWSYGLFVQNGRVKDTPERALKAGLRELAQLLHGTRAEFRLTANQNLTIAQIPERLRAGVDALMARHRLENGRLSGLRLSSMACVALPTCGLAMAESERYLPDLITKLDDVLAGLGLRDDRITIRMTGCPNGCARPQLAEIALVGKAPGSYNLYLGAGHAGDRLNKAYRESVSEPEILDLLRVVLTDYAAARLDGEHFGDFIVRKGYVKATLRGKEFHD
ncbi:hypothetical protein HK405_005791, partial [Cladochytrium tenue]